MIVCRIFIATLLSLMTAGYSFAGLLGLSNPADFYAADMFYVQGSASAVNTIGSLSDLTTNKSSAFDPRSGSNLAVVDVNAAIGYHWKDYQFGLIYRSDWLAQTSAETVRLYQAMQGVRNATPLSSSALAYQVDGMEAQGIQWGRRLDQWHDSMGLRFGLRGALLFGSKSKQQTASGTATADAASVLTIVGTSSDRNSTTDTAANGFQPRLLNQTITGTGYSVDAGALWDAPNGMRIALTLGDVANAMYWNNVPETTLSGSSVYNGQFPGGYKLLSNYTQVLPLRTEVSVSIPWSQYIFQLANENIAGSNLPRVGIAKDLSNGWRTGLDYDLFFGTTGLQFERGGISVFIRFDASGNARGAAAGVSVTHPLKGAF